MNKPVTITSSVTELNFTKFPPRCSRLMSVESPLRPTPSPDPAFLPLASLPIARNNTNQSTYISSKQFAVSPGRTALPPQAKTSSPQAYVFRLRPTCFSLLTRCCGDEVSDRPWKTKERGVSATRTC